MCSDRGRTRDVTRRDVPPVICKSKGGIGGMFSVLIVDDDPSDREGIHDLVHWESLGIKVAGMAANGMEGCLKALELKPDIILTDVAMPLMDGLKMAEYISRELPEARFVFMSCFDDFNYIKEAMDLHAYAYVLKPISLMELTRALENVVNLRQGEIDRERAMRDLKLQLEASRPALQEQFFRDLLYGRVQDIHEILEYMKFLRIDCRDKYYSVVFMQIDNYDLTYPDISIEQKFMHVYSMKNCAESIRIQEHTVYSVLHNYNSLALILIGGASGGQGVLEPVLQALGSFKKEVNTKLNFEITMGVSDFTASLPDIPRLFEKAEYAVKSKFYSAGNRIILASEVKGADALPKYDLQCLRNELGIILEQGGGSDIVRFVDKYYKPGTGMPEPYIKSLSFSIINIVQTVLLEKNESLGSIFDSETSMYVKLSRFETILDIRQWLINILEIVRQYLNRNGNSRFKKIVEDIKAEIDRNFSEISNIDQIVKPLYISPSYANAIFKQHTGSTIFDYLLSKRMETAKKMLTDPSYKIYEIAEKIGYKDKSYFSWVFKEFTGLTPKQYSNKNTV